MPKSRRCTKKPVPKGQPKRKLFCPRSMVRYDHSFVDYPTKWVCKICLKCLLSEEAATNHLAHCTGQPVLNIPPPPTVTPTAIPTENMEGPPYICKICNKMLSRLVVLKRHLEEHKKSNKNVKEEPHDEDEDI